MKNEKILVSVSASFEKKEVLLSTLKKYAQRYDERFAFWDEFAFTTELLPECDAVLVFNTPFEKIRTTCFPENNFAFMMEPGIRWKHPWMFRGLDQYHKVYSPVQRSANTILSHGFLGWYFQQDYNDLKKLPVPGKTKDISCIASNLKYLKGHRRRLNFLNILRERLPQTDLFGKGTRFLEDKMDGLLPYRYSIAIENYSSPHYFTEKINDCFLAYTVPFYYGCKNIGQYFPGKSFISIDIRDPETAIRKMEEMLLHDDWPARLGAVKEARELVLNKYQPLAGAANAFRRIQTSPEKKEIILNPVPVNLLERFAGIISKLAKL